MDHITDLPTSNGFDSILVVCDRFTKMAHFVRAKETDTSQTLAQQFADNIWKYHGLPDDIISDRGTTFTSKWWRAFLKLLGTKPNLSTAFHPETDGQTERINQVIEQHLRTFCCYQQDDWSNLLPFAEHAYNSTFHSTIGMTPFYGNKGYHPRLSVTVQETSVPDTQARVEELKQVHDTCKQNIAKALEQHAFFANKKRLEAPLYNVNDKVWLLPRFIRTNRPSKKLDHKRLGPFTILEKIGNSAFRLQLPASMHIHPVFHVSLLEPYHRNVLPDREPEPLLDPLVNEEGDLLYEIEQILDSRYRGRGKARTLEYFVHWQGYPDSERSWEPASNLALGSDALIEFHTQYPHKPGYERFSHQIRSRRTRA